MGRGLARTCWVVLVAVLMTAPAMAEWGEQTLHLTPGWNAVYLEVQPEDNSCAAVFQDVPIESVWFWNRTFNPKQFVKDPNQLLPENPDWLTYFPVDSPKSFLTDLHAVFAGKAYLIEVGSSQPVELKLSGRVLIRETDWLPNALNLVGFHVDGATPPSFSSFFKGEKALDGQPIYRINAAGQAVEVTDKSVTMKRGEAYWVYCNGDSTYSGPLKVDYDMVDGLKFGETLSEQSLRLTNESDAPRTVTLRVLPAKVPAKGNKSAEVDGPVKLSYLRYTKWEPLEDTLELVVPPKGKEKVELGVRRAEMPSSGESKSTFASLLEVSDNAGQKYVVPVSAEKINAEGGLWAGSVTITKVSEAANPTNVNTPTPASGEFNFRIIVHIDGNGVARLLQSVALMQVQPEVDGTGAITSPGRYVLITDDSLLPQYTGVAMRDGEVVGRRITSPAFSFESPITMTESNNVLQASITTAFTDPTNPFVHKFHPDHDNLNERFDGPVGEGVEAFTFTRTLQLQFEDQDPEQLNLPGWGYDIKGGTYRETIAGVHRNNIVVEGTFRLTRVSDVLELNDGQ